MKKTTQERRAIRAFRLLPCPYRWVWIWWPAFCLRKPRIYPKKNKFANWRFRNERYWEKFDKKCWHSSIFIHNRKQARKIKNSENSNGKDMKALFSIQLQGVNYKNENAWKCQGNPNCIFKDTFINQAQITLKLVKIRHAFQMSSSKIVQNLGSTDHLLVKFHDAKNEPKF